MYGRFQVSLKWFFGFALLVAVFLGWYPTIWTHPTIQLRQATIGRLTSVNDDFDDPLTQDEFEHLLSARQKDGTQTRLKIRAEKNHFHSLGPIDPFFFESQSPMGRAKGVSSAQSEYVEQVDAPK